MKTRSALALFAVQLAVIGVAAAIGFATGHRSGRGRACLEVALATVRQSGQSLREAVLSRPGAKVDYYFWGYDCTLRIAFDEKSGTSVGRWRFDLEFAKLYTENDTAARVFPGDGPAPYLHRPAR
jgi:hypothetical protein